MSRRPRRDTQTALQERQIALSVATRDHDEALVDRCLAVMTATVAELLVRIDNLEHDLRMANTKLDQLIDREQGR